MTEGSNGFGGLSGFLFWELQFRRLKRKNAVPLAIRKIRGIRLKPPSWLPAARVMKMRIRTVALDYAPDYTSTEGVSEWLMKG